MRVFIVPMEWVKAGFSFETHYYSQAISQFDYGIIIVDHFLVEL